MTMKELTYYSVIPYTKTWAGYSRKNWFFFWKLPRADKTRACLAYRVTIPGPFLNEKRRQIWSVSQIMQTQFSLDLEFATSLLSEGLAQANQQEALLNVEEQNIDFNISNMLLTHCIQLPGFIQIFGSITQDFFETFFQNNNFFFQT